MNEQAGICVEIENSLPLYVGGDLESDAMAEIERHISGCAACAARAAEATRARATLISALKLRASGPDLWSGVRAVLAEDGFFAPHASDARRVAEREIAAPRFGEQASVRAASRVVSPAASSEWAASPAGMRRSRLVPLSLAAAAAVVLGVWVGSHFFAGDRSGDGVRRNGVSPNLVDGTRSPTQIVPEIPGGSSLEPVNAVATNQDSLRPLRAGETRLIHGAEIFVMPPRDAEWNADGAAFDDPNAGSPVGLKRVGRRP